MRCTRSLAWGSLILLTYLFILGSTWIGLQTIWPLLDHPLGALVILIVSYVLMEKSVTFLAIKRSWSC